MCSTPGEGMLSVFVWGGDDANGLGIDLGIGTPVPDPGTMLLPVNGAAGLAALRRRDAPAWSDPPSGGAVAPPFCFTAPRPLS